MAQQPSASSGFSLAPEDVIFILSRHKWKILGFLLVGMIGAAVVWKLQKPLHSARAKLMIRYVAETRVLDSTAGPNPDLVRAPEGPRNSVTSSEIELLSSFDTVLGAVRRVEASRILKAFGGGDNPQAAAGVLKRYLTIEPAPGANAVINLSLEHPDPEIALVALKAIIDEYLRKHLEVHSAIGAYDTLQRQVDQLRLELSDTEEQLRSEKKRAGVISLDAAKEEYSTQISRLKTDLYGAEAELEERKAELAQFQKDRPMLQLENTGEGDASGSVTADTKTNSVSREMLEAFSVLSEKLRKLKAQETEALEQYTEESQLVAKIRRQIADTEASLESLGVDPSFVKAIEPVNPGFPVASRDLFDPGLARARIFALEARVGRVRIQLTEVREQAKLLDSFENNILRLERKKEAEEQKLRYSEANLERARFDQAIDATTLNNINLIQEPVRAGRDMTKLHKLIAAIIGGSVAVGLGIAFVTEMFLDRRFKRNKDVEQALHLSLIATVPIFRDKRKLKKLLKGSGKLRGDDDLNSELRHEEHPWDISDPMLPYYEALRDRVVMSYNGEIHKPKIVGVTSFNKGAGTTRVASGLAAALSRDVERNVLFIALEKGKVAVSAFAKGRPVSDSPAEELGEAPDPTKLFVARNLHSLAQSGHNVAGASVVQSFCDLLPKLKACDYDFIIFDLPPISQTSGSLRLVTQMERTLFVLEAEKTSKDVAKAGLAGLNVDKGKLFAVLNKAGEVESEEI